MLRKESEILFNFAKRPWKRYTFSQIKEITGMRSKSYVELALKNFTENGILDKEKLGRQIFYSLDESAKAAAFAGFVLEYHGWQKDLPNMESLIKRIPVKNFVLIVTGSYARQEQKKTSDIDVVILTDDSIKPGRIYAELSHFCEMSIPYIHLYVFRNKEFKEMLLDDEPNYGKEIADNCLVLFGAEVYIRIIKEAVSNGFKDIYQKSEQ